MKTRIWWTLALSSILATLAVAQVKTAGETLSSAIASGKVHAEFHSTGASSGDAITVTVAKAGTKPGTLILTVPPGTRLNNASGTGQSMVIAGVRGRQVGSGMYSPAATMTVSTKPVTYVLEAYCG